MAPGGYWILISTLAGVTSEISLRPLLTRGLHLAGRKGYTEFTLNVLHKTYRHGR